MKSVKATYAAKEVASFARRTQEKLIAGVPHKRVPCRGCGNLSIFHAADANAGRTTCVDCLGTPGMAAAIILNEGGVSEAVFGLEPPVRLHEESHNQEDQ